MRLLTATPPPSDPWVATRWSVLSSLDRRSEPEWEASWSYLMGAYRDVMERYVRRVLSRTRGRPASTADCQEVVQDFLTTCFEKDWLSKAHPGRGRFRSFVKTLLSRFIVSMRRRETALKRHPGRDHRVLSLLDKDLDADLTVDDQADLRSFDRTWVEVAVDRALTRLRDEQERYHEVIRDLLATDGKGSEDMAERMGLRARQLPVLRHRARQRFARFFEEELRHTVGQQEDFEAEWRALAPFFPG